jgi:predicted enzyme related to lactoylglutathione lyase
VEIRGVDFVAYSVEDLEHAIRFYRENLGLPEPFRVEGVYAEFDVGGTAFGLYHGEERQPSGTIAFNVPRIADAVAELKSRGLEPTWEEETPVCRMAGFVDSEGNPFILHETPKV